MSGAKGVGRYPDEMRQRAVRMVFDHQHEYPSQWKAIESISKKLSINHETLRIWVRRAETDAGERPGVTTDERARMRELERENKELRRANEILKAASAFFGAELDRQSKKRPPSARAERDAELVVEIHRAMGDAVGNVPVASWSRYLLAESLFAGRDPGECSSDTADVAKVAPMNRHEIVAYALAQLDTN